MLSATPVNNRFTDLKNQIALAYEGHTNLVDEKDVKKVWTQYSQMHKESSTSGPN
jgi:hypothetical protein